MDYNYDETLTDVEEAFEQNTIWNKEDLFENSLTTDATYCMNDNNIGGSNEQKRIAC
jgi:hypothetical protein